MEQEPKSDSLTIRLIDCTLHRKIKPTQNLSLILAGATWAIIIPLLFLENQAMARLAGYLILFSIIPIILFSLLSIPFLFRKKVGEAFYDSERLILNREYHDLSEVKIELSIHQSSWTNKSENTSKKIRKLPFWGNYIILNSGERFEFDPNEKFISFVPKNLVSGYQKRSVLLVKTTDLFNNIMSILWATS